MSTAQINEQAKLAPHAISKEYQKRKKHNKIKQIITLPFESKAVTQATYHLHKSKQCSDKSSFFILLSHGVHRTHGSLPKEEKADKIHNQGFLLS